MFRECSCSCVDGILADRASWSIDVDTSELAKSKALGAASTGIEEKTIVEELKYSLNIGLVYFEEKQDQATKGTKIKSKAKVAKSDKKKQLAKKPKAKGLAVLSEVALTEAEQLKLATKRSKNDFNISHASGSGDGVDTQSKGLDEQQQKTYESWGDSDEEDDDENDFEEEADINDNDNKTKHDEEDVNERVQTLSDYELTDDEKIHDEENIDEEEEDEVTKDLYDDVNVNLGNDDTEMINADQTTPTPTPTTSEATTSYTSFLDFKSVFKFNERVTSLEKDLLEIKQVDQYAQALSFIPAIGDRYMDNKLEEAINKAIQALNFDCREEAQAKNGNVVTPVIEKNVIESLEADVLTRSSSQPQSSYEAATTLSEFKLTKILIDKMEKKKSFDVADYKRELYDGLVKSYNTDKDIFESYGEVFLLKRSRDDKDKDQGPSVGSNQETKRRKSSKDVESSRDSRSKEKKSSNPEIHACAFPPYELG
nr:hypothetical protein [Tanacetum cinerariifolium]